jgi:hypothetical protein
MKLEDQVTSLELSKKLKELGVNQESLFYWVEIKKGKWECWELIHLMQHWECCHVRDEKPVNKISSYSVAELGEMLPLDNTYIEWDGEWQVHYMDRDSGELESFYDASEANSRAQALIYLLENGLIKL